MIHPRSSIRFLITLSSELLLDRFGQFNKFRKKSKKKFRDIQEMTHIVPKTCFECTPGDVLRTSKERPELTSQGPPLSVRLQHPFRTSLGREIETSSGE